MYYATRGLGPRAESGSTMASTTSIRVCLASASMAAAVGFDSCHAAIPAGIAAAAQAARQGAFDLRRHRALVGDLVDAGARGRIVQQGDRLRSDICDDVDSWRYSCRIPARLEVVSE